MIIFFKKLLTYSELLRKIYKEFYGNMHVHLEKVGPEKVV